MPLIYSDEAGAFIESETPRIRVEGVWQDSVGNICKDGVWEQVWPTKKYLYKSGDECKALTGGWNFWGAYGNPTYSKQAGQIYIATTISGWQALAVSTVNKVDVSGYAKLCMEVEIVRTGGKSEELAFSLQSKKEASAPYFNADIWGNVIAWVHLANSEIVSGLNQLSFSVAGRETGYVTFGFSHSSAGCAFKIKKVWLEK